MEQIKESENVKLHDKSLYQSSNLWFRAVRSAVIIYENCSCKYWVSENKIKVNEKLQETSNLMRV